MRRNEWREGWQMLENVWDEGGLEGMLEGVVEDVSDRPTSSRDLIAVRGCVQEYATGCLKMRGCA